MKKNYNRDQFKRIFSFFAAVLLVGLYAAGFAWVWYESYSDAILLPFYRRGNWVMILIYVVLVLLFAKSFGGLKIGYLKRTVCIVLFGLMWSIVMELKQELKEYILEFPQEYWLVPCSNSSRYNKECRFIGLVGGVLGTILLLMSRWGICLL